MKHLGNILHLANSGKLIVRSEQMPPAHAFVYTNDKQKIGKVYNVFGPVKNPYVAVSLFKSVNRRDLESRTGERRFMPPQKKSWRNQKLKTPRIVKNLKINLLKIKINVLKAISVKTNQKDLTKRISVNKVCINAILPKNKR